jgi:hypothetical protein
LLALCGLVIGFFFLITLFFSFPGGVSPGYVPVVDDVEGSGLILPFFLLINL